MLLYERSKGTECSPSYNIICLETGEGISEQIFRVSTYEPSTSVMCK